MVINPSGSGCVPLSGTEQPIIKIRKKDTVTIFIFAPDTQNISELRYFRSIAPISGEEPEM